MCDSIMKFRIPIRKKHVPLCFLMSLVLCFHFHRLRETRRPVHEQYSRSYLLSAFGYPLLPRTIKRETVFVVNVRFCEKVVRANTRSCCSRLRPFLLYRGQWSVHRSKKSRSPVCSPLSWSVLLARLSVSRLLTVLERTGEFTQVYCSPVAILCRFFSSLFGNEPGS